MLWRLPPVVSDAVVALVVGVFSVGNAFHDGHRLWLNVPLAVLGAASLLVRRRHPLAVLGVLTVLCLPLAAQGQYWLYPAVLFALFTAAQRGPRPWAARMSAAAVGVIGLTVLVKQGFNIGPVIAPAAFTAAAWVWGVNVRTRDLEREEQARAAVGAERARIAGELHDVITHNVSVMVVQAAAGNDVFDARPDQAREALQAVEATGRSTLAELRSCSAWPRTTRRRPTHRSRGSRSWTHLSRASAPPVSRPS